MCVCQGQRKANRERGPAQTELDALAALELAGRQREPRTRATEMRPAAGTAFKSLPPLLQLGGLCPVEPRLPLVATAPGCPPYLVGCRGASKVLCGDCPPTWPQTEHLSAEALQELKGHRRPLATSPCPTCRVTQPRGLLSTAGPAPQLSRGQVPQAPVSLLPFIPLHLPILQGATSMKSCSDSEPARI